MKKVINNVTDRVMMIPQLMPSLSPAFSKWMLILFHFPGEESIASQWPMFMHWKMEDPLSDI